MKITRKDMVGKMHNSTILTLSVVWLAGCPKPREAGTAKAGRPRASGRQVEADVRLPDGTQQVLAFAREHRMHRDDFVSLARSVAAYRKLLQDGKADLSIWKEAVETACRAAEIADQEQDLKRYSRLTIAWARAASDRFPKEAVFPYRWAVAIGLEFKTSVRGALDKVKEVERLAEKARSLDEKLDFAGPLRLLGALYVRAPEVGSIGDPDKGVDLLKRAVALFPDYPPNHYFLGEGYYKQEDYPKAAKEFRFVLQAAPSQDYTARDAKWFRAHARGYLKKISRKQPSGPEVRCAPPGARCTNTPRSERETARQPAGAWPPASSWLLLSPGSSWDVLPCGPDELSMKAALAGLWPSWIPPRPRHRCSEPGPFWAWVGPGRPIGSPLANSAGIRIPRRPSSRLRLPGKPAFCCPPWRTPKTEPGPVSSRTPPNAGSGD